MIWRKNILNAKIRKKYWVCFLQAIKIAIGSGVAIYIAMLLNLENATSSGIITMLTLVTTKLETIRLSAYRLLTFYGAAVVSFLIFPNVENIVIAYGIFMLIVVFFTEMAGIKATLSVNAVIGTHFLITLDFSREFILNEFLLVIIGISIAMLLNSLGNNNNSEKRLIHNIKYTEHYLEIILELIANYLKNGKLERNVWNDIKILESHIEHFLELSFEYKENTFNIDKEYYVHYFEMRLMQCEILEGLHYEMKKICKMPDQAHIVADCLLEIKGQVLELNDPIDAISAFEEMFEKMKQEELPKTRDEFEAQAKLYHILMDLEEFLYLKKRYVESVVTSVQYIKRLEQEAK